MAKVIASNNIEKYNVNRYNFKVLSCDDDEECHVENEPQQQQPVKPVPSQPQPQFKDTKIDASEISSSSKDALIESLMKKTDEMSSNFIKLQMKLEAKDDEYKAELEKVKENSFNEGVSAGLAQAGKDYEQQVGAQLAQYSTSVATLEKSANEFEIALEGIKSSLITAAIDIATEVIKIELEQNSAKIASVLSEELIKELQSASKITLKVNSQDHGEISKTVGRLEHVEIISDAAVSKGGVIAISEAGNIDSQISKRFERVKKAALSE
jgi:flagellar assembly protein FliH